MEVTAIMHDIGSVSAIAEFENDEHNDRHEPAGTERSSKNSSATPATAFLVAYVVVLPRISI